MQPPEHIKQTAAAFSRVFGSAPALLPFEVANARAKSSTFEHDTKDLEAEPEALAAWTQTAFVDAGEAFRWLASLPVDLRAEAVEGEWVFGWFVEQDDSQPSDPEGEFCSTLSVEDLEDLEDLRHAVEHASRFGCLFVEVRPAR